MENKREILKVVDLQKKFHKLEVLKGIIGFADRVKVTGESNRILSVKTEDVI